jgi:CheY-like chemotaxis protein
MPLKNGLQVVKEVRHLYSREQVEKPSLKLPEIVFSTAFSSKALRQHLQQNQVRYCLDKPLNLEQLQTVI